MPPVEINIIVGPISDALSTNSGVIGLLVGLLGRELFSYARGFYRSARGLQNRE